MRSAPVPRGSIGGYHKLTFNLTATVDGFAVTRNPIATRLPNLVKVTGCHPHSETHPHQTLFVARTKPVRANRRVAALDRRMGTNALQRVFSCHRIRVISADIHWFSRSWGILLDALLKPRPADGKCIPQLSWLAGQQTDGSANGTRHFREYRDM
jgi:hypothetical protein